MYFSDDDLHAGLKISLDTLMKNCIDNTVDNASKNFAAINLAGIIFEIYDRQNETDQLDIDDVIEDFDPDDLEDLQ